MILSKAKKRRHCWCAFAAEADGTKRKDLNVDISDSLSFARIVKADCVPRLFVCKNDLIQNPKFCCWLLGLGFSGSMITSFCGTASQFQASQHRGSSTFALLTTDDTAKADISSEAYGVVMWWKTASGSSPGENHSSQYSRRTMTGIRSCTGSGTAFLAVVNKQQRLMSFASFQNAAMANGCSFFMVNRCGRLSPLLHS